MPFDFTKIVAAPAKPVPLLLLLDASISMEGSKIDELNKAVREMVSSLSGEVAVTAPVQLAAIAFSGSGARLLFPFTDVRKAEWRDLTCAGGTPLGSALQMARDIINGTSAEAKLPKPCYRPTVVLVSDGDPNDQYEVPLNEFVASGSRTASCVRLSLCIFGPHGATPKQREVMRTFAGDAGNVIDSNEAEKISEFFQLVTMSVSSRSRSSNPDIADLKLEQYSNHI